MTSPKVIQLMALEQAPCGSTENFLRMERKISRLLGQCSPAESLAYWEYRTMRAVTLGEREHCEQMVARWSAFIEA